MSQIFFLINIQFPRTVNFDEFHYVPSAKEFLNLQMNRNWEHPPLGKLMMALGIQIWGDRPIGWRFMSTVFGAITLSGMYALGLILFESETTALWITLLTLFNQLLYVQSRIGMLDSFMIAFLIWGLASFAATWNPKRTLQEGRKLLGFTGLMMGLATACKWFGVIPWFAIVFLILGVRTLQSWRTVFSVTHTKDWYRPNLWRSFSSKDLVITLGLVPIGAYFVTFLPFLWVPGAITSPLDFLAMQYRMWDGQLRVVTNHPYNSHWSDWAILKRPIWYAFDREGTPATWVRGVLMLGNPLIMWSGLIAISVCIGDWLRHRNWDAFFIAYFYLVFYGCWLVIPRKISFYYYYYPAGMMLSFALAYLFTTIEHGKSLNLKWARWAYLGAAFAIFIYFFPILAALKIPFDSFRQWMWFNSWI